MGAYWGYVVLMEGMGRDIHVLAWDQKALVSDSFYGTTYSASGAGWVEPDSIYTIVPEGGTKGRVTVTRYPEGKPIEGGLYYPEKLEVKDKYAYFLGGNQPLCVIRNPDAAGGKLLVVRDLPPSWRRNSRRSTCSTCATTTCPSRNMWRKTASIRCWCSIRAITSIPIRTCSSWDCEAGKKIEQKRTGAVSSRRLSFL